MHDNNLQRIRKVEEILSNIIKSKEANNYLNSLDKGEKPLYQMFRYTESIFQFMIVYCKDNSYIKKELYKNLYVFFIFMNLSSSCIDAMIEIFKNEESNLNFLIRDCIERKPFHNTLTLLYNKYFKEFRDQDEKKKIRGSLSLNDPNNKKNITKNELIDLSIEFIRA